MFEWTVRVPHVGNASAKESTTRLEVNEPSIKQTKSLLDTHTKEAFAGWRDKSFVYFSTPKQWLNGIATHQRQKTKMSGRRTWTYFCHMPRWLYSLLSSSCICSMFIKNCDRSRVSRVIMTSSKPPRGVSKASRDISMSTFSFLVRGKREAQVSALLQLLLEEVPAEAPGPLLKWLPPPDGTVLVLLFGYCEAPPPRWYMVVWRLVLPTLVLSMFSYVDLPDDESI